MTLFPGIEIKDIDVRGVDTIDGGTPFWFFRMVSGFLAKGDQRGLTKMWEEAGDDAEAIIYDLEIKAATKELAEQKARAFVRGHNPFSPSLVKIVKSRPKGGGQARWRDTYKIEIMVEK